MKNRTIFIIYYNEKLFRFDVLFLKPSSFLLLFSEMKSIRSNNKSNLRTDKGFHFESKI